MPAAPGLNLHVVLCGAFDECRHVVRRVRPDHGCRGDDVVEVVRQCPFHVVERRGGIRDAIVPAVAHGFET